jgi:hypothetical protein
MQVCVIAEAYLALGAVFNQTKDYPKPKTALFRGRELEANATCGHCELAKPAAPWAVDRKSLPTRAKR